MIKHFLILTCLLSCFFLHANAQKSLNRQLYEAVSSTDTLQVEALLGKNADANYKEKLMTFEMSMLILAVQKESFKTVKLLIEHKAEVDWKDMFKTTALMYAAHSGT
jgi:ankyrin repeat protein